MIRDGIMGYSIEELKTRAIEKQDIGAGEAYELARMGRGHPFVLMAAADQIRETFKGKKISLCGIVNAKSGLCTEDCSFCPQSAHYATTAPEYPLMKKENIIEAARQARMAGAHMFAIVTSGTRVNNESEWNEIYESIGEIADLGMKPCASLGMLGMEQAARLKKAGLFRYHHNLETARSNFSHICTTHDYQEDIDTVLAAKHVGLSTCSGGIIGLGESMEQRIELALTLRELDVDCVPFNILNPRPGTPLEHAERLSPVELLVTIAVYRFILAGKDIKLCGGKEANLRQLLPLGMIAGSNALMIGNYLTTSGRSPDLDKEMIRDLGFEAVFE